MRILLVLNIHVVLRARSLLFWLHDKLMAACSVWINWSAIQIADYASTWLLKRGLNVAIVTCSSVCTLSPAVLTWRRCYNYVLNIIID